MATENTSHQPQESQPPERLNYETLRRQQITRLSHQLLDAVEGKYSQAWMGQDWLDDKRNRLTQLITDYVPGKKAPERTPFSADTVSSVFRVMQVYLEDTSGMLDIPTEVVMLFEDESHTERRELHKNRPIKSAREIRSRLKEVVEKSSRSLENADYRPLVVVGYRNRQNYGAGEGKIEEGEVLNAGNTDVLLWNHRGKVMRQFGGIKARTIIVDDRTADTLTRDEQKDLSLACDILGMTTEAHIGSSSLTVKDGLLQVGGTLLSRGGPLTLQRIHQIGGVNNAPRITVTNYTQLAGENNSADTIVLGSYHLGEDAKLAARHVWLSEAATFTTDGGAIISYPPRRGLPPEFEEEPTDDIYRSFGKELVQHYFPHDTEHWSEMQVLFDAWYDDFRVTHQIPTDFMGMYKSLLTNQHHGTFGSWGNESYTAVFGIIANLVAFFYLNKLAPLPEMNRKTFIDSPEFKEFASLVRDAHGDNVLIFMNGYSERDLPGRFVVAHNIQFGEGTVFKGGSDRWGMFMQHVKRLTAQTVIINSPHDQKAHLGDASMEYTDHIVHISCDNLGVMVRGDVDPRVKLQCNESVLQYGHIGRVKSIGARRGEEIKIHMQEAGKNEAETEVCRAYEQHGGTMSVGVLQTNIYDMIGGTAADSHIRAGKFHARSGSLKNVVIESEDITIEDNVVIGGNVTIRYRGKKPIIGNVITQGKVVLEQL